MFSMRTSIAPPPSGGVQSTASEPPSDASYAHAKRLRELWDASLGDRLHVRTFASPLLRLTLLCVWRRWNVPLAREVNTARRDVTSS